MFRRRKPHAEDAPRRRGTIGIRTLLALAMGGLVFLVSATVLLIALFASATNTFELLNQRTVLVVEGIENEVREKLEAAEEAVKGFQREVQAGSLSGASHEKLQDALAVALATVPEVEVLLYWDRGGARRLAARDPDGAIVTNGPEAEENPEILEGQSAIAEGEAAWGAPVVEDGATYMNFAARLAPGDTDVAFVVAAVSLEHFSEFVAGIGQEYGGVAFLLYGEDQVLAHPAFVRAGAEAERRALVPVAEAGDPVLMHLAEGRRPGEVMAAARREGVELLRVATTGGDHMVMYRWLHGYGPEPIAVGVHFPRSETVDTLNRLAMSAAAGALVTIVGVIAAALIGGLVARPVQRLAASASAVARLDLDAVEAPRRSPIAEVDAQARAFGMMLDALKVFQTYVPRKLVQRLVALEGGQGVHSEQRELTVMFTDIVKFSEIADRMGAEDTAAFLNRHFALLAECINAEDGTIDKYVGDAVLAFWGAPDRMDDHAARAVRAARGISETVAADNRRRAGKGLRPVRVRVGLHTGQAMVGNIGAPARINYTVVGDTVNDVQRLESLGRKLDVGADVTVLMSAETAVLAGMGPDDVEDVGAHRLAGDPEEVPVRRLRS
jgi:adenylate cyclase